MGIDRGWLRSLGSAGTTFGAGNDQMTTCGGGGRGPDVTFGWIATRTATYIFDTEGSMHDTVLHLRVNDCTGMELACDDDSGATFTSSITRTVRAGTRFSFGVLLEGLMQLMQALSPDWQRSDRVLHRPPTNSASRQIDTRSISDRCVSV